MEDDYLDIEEVVPENHSEFESGDESGSEDWTTSHNDEHIHNEDDPWLNSDPFAESVLSETPENEAGYSNDWDSSNSTIDKSDNDNVDDNDMHQNVKGSAISFTGYGRCGCGCGSFGGHGNICSYCGHPFSAHSRYKKP